MTIQVETPFRFSFIEGAGRHFRWPVLSLFLLSFACYLTEMDTMKRSLYVLSVLLLTVLLLACAALTAPAPRPSLKEWGDPVDPDQDCKIRLDGGVLSIEMPGTEHEYDPLRRRFNAPRILREIEGEFDLRVRVRIDCPRSAQSSVQGHPAYVAAGFLIIYPDSPRYEFFCNRWDYGFMQQRVGIDDFPDKPRFLAYPQIEKESRKGIGEDGCVLENGWDYASGATENGGLIINRNLFRHNALFLLDRGWRGWPLQGRADCVYLRLKREDKQGLKRESRQVGFSISPDGVKWTELRGNAWDGRPKKIKVGLAAYTTSSEPSSVRFDQIKLWRGKQKKQ
jgi:hypothetical protein